MRHAAVFATAASLLLAAAAAATEPQPCLDDSMPGFEPYEAATRPPDVLFSPVKLAHAGRDHPVHAFSAVAEDPNDARRACVRHELRNIGEDEVFAVRWARGGIRAERLRPAGDPRDIAVNASRWPGYPPHVPAPGVVTAFANAADRAEAYAQPRFSEAAPGFIFAAATDALAPALQVALRDVAAEAPGRAVEGPFTAYAFGGEGDPPPLESRFSTGGQIARFISTARIDADGWVTVENIVDAESLAGTVVAPFLDALADADFSAPDRAYPATLAAFDENRRDPAAPISGGGAFTLRFPAPVGSGPSLAVAVVRHPATVLTEGGVDCVMVATYAPAPFALSLDDCHGFGTN